jgi:hypothetical protein
MSELRLVPSKGQSFSNTWIAIDDHQFVNCRFSGCTLVYSGGAARAENCEFRDCRWILQGPFAEVLETLLSFGITLQFPQGQKVRPGMKYKPPLGG